MEMDEKLLIEVHKDGEIYKCKRIIEVTIYFQVRLEYNMSSI